MICIPIIFCFFAAETFYNCNYDRLEGFEAEGFGGYKIASAIAKRQSALHILSYKARQLYAQTYQTPYRRLT